MKEFVYTIVDPIGMHARPAGMLVKLTKDMDSTVTVKKGDKSSVTTRLMALMALGVKTGDHVTVTIEGGNEEENTAKVQAFFHNNL